MLSLVVAEVRINVFRSAFGPTWNVDAINRAIKRGDFGKPRRLAMSILPKMSETERANIDWDKVGRLMLQYRTNPNTAAVRIPAVQVITQLPGEGFLRRLFVDGNHRITARQQLKMRHFLSYIVPPEIEFLYRLKE